MDMVNAHSKIEPISELVTGHANRLIAQGCPADLAWQMAEQMHRTILEGQRIDVRSKFVAAELKLRQALERERNRKQ